MPLARISGWNGSAVHDRLLAAKPSSWGRKMANSQFNSPATLLADGSVAVDGSLQGVDPPPPCRTSSSGS
jgi:hypothetical protein